MNSVRFDQQNKANEKKDNKRRSATVIAASVAALWLVFELIAYVVSIPRAPELSAKDVIVNEAGSDGYDINDGVTLQIKNGRGAIDTISFEAIADRGQTTASGALTVKVWGIDPANSAQVIYKTESFYVGTDRSAKKVLRMDIPSRASNLYINFSHDGVDYNVCNIKFNAKEDAHFNFSRAVIVLAVIALVWACSYFELWKKVFSAEKHGRTALSLCLACVIIAVFMALITNGVGADNTYPIESNLSYYNPYIQQFDAFMKGQLHLDVEPSKELLALEDPYDYAARDGISYLWDRAFYEGKYYSYFGIGPILSVYFPYYFLTGGLPADNTVMMIFTVMTALFFSMAAVKWAAMFTKKLPLPLMLFGIVSALLSTQLFLIMRGRASFYYIATAGGMAFLSLFIWLMLCGISGSFKLNSSDKSPPRYRRIVIFALAGVAYGLCFLSRYNIALLAAFVIVPTLWFCIVRERVELDGKVKQVFRPARDVVCELLALALPVIIAIGAQLILNYARFDSFFEFGTTYQLTVSDISKNKLRLTDIPMAVFHYFLQPLSLSSDFPFFSLQADVVGNYGHYVYVDTGMGLFSIPLMWGLFGGIAIFVNKNRSRFSKILLASLLAGAFAVAILDFCLGGVIFRYTCDLTLLCAFGAMAVVFAVYEDFSIGGSETAQKSANVIAMTLFVLSVIVCLSLAFSLNANLQPYDPSVYLWIASLLGA